MRSKANVRYLLLGLSLLASSRAFVLPPSRAVTRTSAVPTTSMRFLSEETTTNEETTPNDSSPTTISALDRPLLTAIDATSLLVFAGIGKASHNPDGSLDIAAIASVAAPFLVAWFATSNWTGVYSKTNTTNGLTDTVLQTSKGWIVAIPLGCALRGVVKGYVPPLPFVIVTMIATFVLLNGTRCIYEVVTDKLIE